MTCNTNVLWIWFGGPSTYGQRVLDSLDRTLAANLSWTSCHFLTVVVNIGKLTNGQFLHGLRPHWAYSSPENHDVWSLF